MCCGKLYKPLIPTVRENSTGIEEIFGLVDGLYAIKISVY